MPSKKLNQRNHVRYKQNNRQRQAFFQVNVQAMDAKASANAEDYDAKIEINAKVPDVKLPANAQAPDTKTQEDAKTEDFQEPMMLALKIIELTQPENYRDVMTLLNIQIKHRLILASQDDLLQLNLPIDKLLDKNHYNKVIWYNISVTESVLAGFFKIMSKGSEEDLEFYKAVYSVKNNSNHLILELKEQNKNTEDEIFQWERRVRARESSREFLFRKLKNISSFFYHSTTISKYSCLALAPGAIFTGKIPEGKSKLLYLLCGAGLIVWHGGLLEEIAYTLFGAGTIKSTVMLYQYFNYYSVNDKTATAIRSCDPEKTSGLRKQIYSLSVLNIYYLISLTGIGLSAYLEQDKDILFYSLVGFFSFQQTATLINAIFGKPPDTSVIDNEDDLLRNIVYLTLGYAGRESLWWCGNTLRAQFQPSQANTNADKDEKAAGFFNSTKTKSKPALFTPIFPTRAFK